MKLDFCEVFDDYTSRCRKIPKEEYLSNGKYIVIDQGQNNIAGYTNIDDGLFEDVPAIVFGDHTRIIKYVDEPFFLGADGVKLLKSKIKDANYKYLYYALRNARIPDTGYNRHFKWLKEINLEYKDAESQKNIAKTLDTVTNIIELYKVELSKLDNLIRARFVEMFGNPVRNSKNWNTEKLCSIAPINKYNGDIDTVNGKVWLLNLDMIESCTGNIVDFLYEFENRITSSTIKFDENCVLYSKLRPYLNKVVIPERKGYATSELVSMSTEKINKYFLANLLRQDSFVNFSNATAYGAKMPRASMDLIKNFDVINPPTELQNQFGKLVIEVEKSKLLAASQPQIHIYKTLTLL